MLFEFYRTALEEIVKRLFNIYSETAGSQHLPYILSYRTNLIISYKSVPLNQLHHYYILYNLSMKEDRTKEAGKEILLLILFF